MKSNDNMGGDGNAAVCAFFYLFIIVGSAVYYNLSVQQLNLMKDSIHAYKNGKLTDALCYQTERATADKGYTGDSSANYCLRFMVHVDTNVTTSETVLARRNAAADVVIKSIISGHDRCFYKSENEATEYASKHWPMLNFPYKCYLWDRVDFPFMEAESELGRWTYWTALPLIVLIVAAGVIPFLFIIGWIYYKYKGQQRQKQNSNWKPSPHVSDRPKYNSVYGV